jgi:hypothetical protein
MFERCQTTCTPLWRDAYFGSPGLSLRGSWVPLGGFSTLNGTPNALQGRGLDRMGCLLEAPGLPLGGLPAPKGTSKDTTNMKPVT